MSQAADRLAEIETELARSRVRQAAMEKLLRRLLSQQESLVSLVEAVAADDGIAWESPTPPTFGH